MVTSSILRTPPPLRKSKTKTGKAKSVSIKVANDIAAGKRYLASDGPADPRTGRRAPLPRDATPLDVLLLAMRTAYEFHGSMRAADYAVMAAPYLHAKISAIELKGKDDGPVNFIFGWADGS